MKEFSLEQFQAEFQQVIDADKPPHDDHVERWAEAQERAAIMEYDGELSRSEAEQKAGLRLVHSKPRPIF